MNPVAVIVAENGDAGGIGRYCVDLAREMGPRIHVACLCPRRCDAVDDCWLASQCADRDVRLHRVPMPAKGWRSGVLGLIRLWRDDGRPMVHVNGRRGNAVAMAARLGLPGFRYVTTVHGVLGVHHRRNAAYRVVDLAAGRLARRVISVSEHGRKAMIRAGSSKDRTVTIRNGLSDVDLRNLRTIAASRVSRPSKKPMRVGFLGRLSPEKGTQELVALARALAGEEPAMSVDIGGDGPDRAWMTQELADLSASGFVRWRGIVNDVAAYLSEVDVLVVPSHNEGMPYVVLEGMAAGCVAVAFRVGGIPEIIEDPSVGILLEPGDVTGLIEVVTRLASDGPRRQSIGAAASAHVEAGFALSTMLPEILDAYGLDGS